MPHKHSRPDPESDREQHEAEPVRIWRTRRRWYYVILVAAALAFLGGGWLGWYHADFPLPRIDDPHTRDRIPRWLFRMWRGAHEQRIDLLVWKESRETKHLDLSGTIWAGNDSEAIIEFTSEGLFHWRQAPWMAVEQEPAATDSDYPASLEGRPWRFLREVPPNPTYSEAGITYHIVDRFPKGPNPPNLEFPGSDWSAHILFDGRFLFVSFDSPEWNDRFPLYFVFTRQLSTED